MGNSPSYPEQILQIKVISCSLLSRRRSLLSSNYQKYIKSKILLLFCWNISINIYPLTMSQSYLNSFPIEKVLLCLEVIPPSIFILRLVEFFLEQVVFNHGSRFHKLFSGLLKSFHQSKSRFLDHFKAQNGEKKQQDFELCKGQPSFSGKMDDETTCSQEVEILMGNLGIFCHPEGEKLPERLDSDDISILFEEKEPSLEEVKGAFDVFDENRDGFIDAKELQRILCALGVKEGSNIGNCRRMISSFDDNGDGRIDFNEFVKFMENSFC